MGITDCAKETAELFVFLFSGAVARTIGLGRKAQSRGVLPAPLAKATRAGHGNKLVILERLESMV